MASVRSIDDALSITLNTNGRVLRNLIHGADTVMSHILHFYHLAAADFVDITALGAPWDPAFGSLSNCVLAPLTTINPYNGGATKQLVESYVAALNVRKEAHTMSAIFSGRHPIQNAIVPGGVATIFTQSDVDTFRTKLNTVRNFINDYYIPDVVFVATRTSLGWHNYWNVGTNPTNLLSYGEYPQVGDPFPDVTNADMLLARGASIGVLGALSFASTAITEEVDYSFYSSVGGLHPSAGITTPLTGAALQSAMTSGPQYSWLKAPRYNGNAMEVGPLARVVVSYIANNLLTANDTAGGIAGCTLLTGAPVSMPNPYTVRDLVNAAVVGVNALGPLSIGLGNLYSPLGRHAARALECKLVADAMYAWAGQLSGLVTTDGETVPYTTNVAVGSGYSYVQIPKATVMGEGLAEAPRGALGHWITIQNKKIGSYQCVVPSTWNCGPKGTSGTDRGPAESALMGLQAAASDAHVNDAICNIARMLHPYDFCIACAVHLVTPEGKELAKFQMDLDGKIKRFPVDSE